jgi:ABC-type lipoprotein export system ATPase subunit
MPPKQFDIREVSDLSFACYTARRRFKKQNSRNLAQLLLVTSELGAAAVAELADKERQRISAARAAQQDRAIAPACADPERIR